MQHEIYLDGPISDETTRYVRTEIAVAKSNKAAELLVLIDSPGGDVFAGYAIYNLLKESGIKVVTHAYGMCASIASLIFLSGQVRKMSTLAKLMIHNPWGEVRGESKDMRTYADRLDTVKAEVLLVYRAKSRVEAGKLSEMMDTETYINAQDAFEYGFATEEPATINNSQLITIMNKSKEQQKAGLFAELKNEFVSLFKKAGVIKNQAHSLEDGTQIFSDGEIEVGSKLFSDEAMTTPVADAAHRVKISDMVWIITTVGGEVTEMDQDSADPLSEEIENLKAALEAKEAELTEANAKLATQSEAILKIQEKVELLEKIELGTQKTIKASQRQPDADPAKKQGWDKVAAGLLSKYEPYK